MTRAVHRDPAIGAWFDEVTDPFRMIVRPWFQLMRECGSDVRELVHDGCPTACVQDAAFAYVAAHSSHAAVGFFNGADLPDPANLLIGKGKRMRHVKLRPGVPVDDAALSALVEASYAGIRLRVSGG